jgi:DNA-binding MarR family transcriptional regulator
VDVSTFGRMVDRLVRQGLLERRDLPGDRRSKALFLLPTGEDRLAAGYVHVAAVEKRILAPLPPDQQSAFRTMLGLLTPPQDGYQRRSAIHPSL